MTNIRNKKLLKKFGNQVRKLREEAGMSQEDLAIEADISISQVGRIERGEINTTLSTADVLAKALGVELRTLTSL